MKRLDQVSKGLENIRKETALNTRSVQANFPLIERKLDILSVDHDYNMAFPLTKNNHSALLNITIKPDNCCECDPGSATLIRDGEAYFQGGTIGPSMEYEYNKPYPAIYTTDITQTGSIFNMGWGLWGMFTYPIYNSFPSFGGYAIAPNGRILIPVDGVYSIMFQCDTMGTIASPAASFTQYIKRDTTDDKGKPYTETLSKKVYSVQRGNIDPIFPAFPGNGHPLLYATCVNLNKGDTVGGWLEINDVSGFNVGGWLGPGPGFGDTNNDTRILLLGLGYGILLGYVFDIETHAPIQGTSVTYSNEFGGGTTTDEFGGYAFYTLTPGTYTVTATMPGYKTQTQTVAVLFNKVSNIDFNLTHL